MVKQQKRLPKGASFALALLLLLCSLAGCGGKAQKGLSNTDGPTNTYTPPVNEDGYIVITMPKTLLGGKTANERNAAEDAHSIGISNCRRYFATERVISRAKFELYFRA